MLSICILLDQVGRLSKLMFQLAKVFKALFGALPGEARRLECISFFFKEFALFGVLSPSHSAVLYIY